jgi:hypothetical protein
MFGQTRRSPVLMQRAVSEDPRWTRAVGDHLASPQGNGYRLAEIADYLSAYDAAVSCRLDRPSKQMCDCKA